MSRAAWLERRQRAWGCSDLPALWLAAGLANADEAPSYIKQRVSIPRGHKTQRFILEKAGIVDARSAGGAAARGTERERELLTQYREHVRRGALPGPLPETLAHADTVPTEWLPLVDRECTRLACTPDAWGRDALGLLYAVEIKCSVTERPALPWYWALQLQGEIACLGADGGWLVCGEHWAAHHGQDGPIRAWEVERDDALIQQIREVCLNAWELVEKAKETTENV